MKRILLLGIILVICILAMPQGVSADPTGTGDVIVDANIVSSITFIPTGMIVGTWQLYYDPTDVGTPPVSQGPVNTYEDAVHFDVDSNTPFDIQVEETGGDGIMSAADGTEVLANSLWIGSGATYYDISLDPTIVSNEPAAPTGTTLDRNLRQEIEFGDVRLADDYYEITLTFNCVPYVLG